MYPHHQLSMMECLQIPRQNTCIAMIPRRRSEKPDPRPPLGGNGDFSVVSRTYRYQIGVAPSSISGIDDHYASIDA